MHTILDIKPPEQFGMFLIFSTVKEDSKPSVDTAY